MTADQVQRLRTSVLLDALGNVLEVHRGHGPTPAGYTWLPQSECCERVMEEPRRWRVETRQGVAGGWTVEKVQVWLSVDDLNFIADGVDAAVVTVACVPEGKAETRLIVNGSEVLLPRGETLEIVTTEPGLWDVRLADSEVWCETLRLMIRGWPDTPENRVAYRPTPEQARAKWEARTT